jgi:lysophospholipase L1-like esterase
MKILGKSRLVVCFIALLTLSCEEGIPELANNINTMNQPINTVVGTLDYLALGDSYTMGYGVTEWERWPSLLVKQLGGANVTVNKYQLLASSGWTTTDLLKGIRDAQIEEGFGLVSLQIGVNNQFRGISFETYQQEFEQLLTKAIALADGRPWRVLVLSIPDYSVTEYVDLTGLDKQSIQKEINAYNLTAKLKCEQYGVVYCDITNLSRLAGTDPEMTASDGLHPSAEMYAHWVSKCYPLVMDQLGKQ